MTTLASISGLTRIEFDQGGELLGRVPIGLGDANLDTLFADDPCRVSPIAIDLPVRFALLFPDRDPTD